MPLLAMQRGVPRLARRRRLMLLAWPALPAVVLLCAASAPAAPPVTPTATTAIDQRLVGVPPGPIRVCIDARGAAHRYNPDRPVPPRCHLPRANARRFELLLQRDDPTHLGWIELWQLSGTLRLRRLSARLVRRPPRAVDWFSGPLSAGGSLLLTLVSRDPEPLVLRRLELRLRPAPATRQPQSHPPH